MEQLNTQFTCHFQITYYKLTHGTHKTPLQIMMPDSFFEKARIQVITTDLNFVGATISI